MLFLPINETVKNSQLEETALINLFRSDLIEFPFMAQNLAACNKSDKSVKPEIKLWVVPNARAIQLMGHEASAPAP